MPPGVGYGPNINTDGELIDPWGNLMPGAPVDAFQPVIRRDQFPQGAEGDRAYRDAVREYQNTQNQVVSGFDRQGNPVVEQVYDFVPETDEGLAFAGSGRSPVEQAIFNFSPQRGTDRGRGGEAIRMRAKNRPEEAMLALTASGYVPDDHPGFQQPMTKQPVMLDDETIRMIISGLGGPEVVEQLADEMNVQFGEQYIPQSEEEIAENQQAYEDTQEGPITTEEAQRINQERGGTPAQGEQQSFITTYPGDHNMREIAPGVFMPSDTSSVGTSPAYYFNEGTQQYEMISNTDGTPDGTAADWMQTGDGTEVQPEEEGHDLATGPPPVIEGGAYQYSEVGPDTFLDVTDPTDGSTHRFTGDVVDAAINVHGYTSWPEMVVDLGYDDAVRRLFLFKNPPPSPAPPTQSAPPQQAPTQQAPTQQPPAEGVPTNPALAQPPGPQPTGGYFDENGNWVVTAGSPGTGITP